MIEFRRYADFSLFKQDVLPFLEQHEGINISLGGKYKKSPK
ncbi:hypothetical protein BDD39_001424 [Saccharococcus thermophilus]|jgi:uncharacterized protein|uniref:Uncharacterized protein n=1 Tax=Saccharococcus thermophilus TaxID=29396 RepID=A0A846MI17_9BACL|nr:hypothetical protein [Saccharococcus thermophilus]